jgi:hypothetical protein
MHVICGLYWTGRVCVLGCCIGVHLVSGMALPACTPCNGIFCGVCRVGATSGSESMVVQGH